MAKYTVNENRSLEELNNATTSKDGLMAANDKTKLNGVAPNADDVSFTQTVTSGTKIGEININGNSQNIYVPNQYILLNTNGGIGSIAGEGQYPGCKICTIQTDSLYMNRPITLEVSGRGIVTSIINIMFQNSGSTDPALLVFTSTNYGGFYMYKKEANIWELYCQYTEYWGTLYLHRITGEGSVYIKSIDLVNVDSIPSSIAVTVK